MAKTIIKAQMKQRIDTEDNWKAKNPVLLNGELGLISGDPRYKIGNGTTPWNDLPFLGVGIEEYDNRTLVQADGLVGTDDVHYFLPNANPTDKKHTFAMLSDIPEGGGGSGASSGPLRVWINEIVGVENTPEQIAENVATYNVLARRETPMIQLIAVLDEEDLYTNVVSIPDQYSLMVSTKGNIIVEIGVKLGEEPAYITLREDGSVTIEGLE